MFDFDLNLDKAAKIATAAKISNIDYDLTEDLDFIFGTGNGGVAIFTDLEDATDYILDKANLN